VGTRSTVLNEQRRLSEQSANLKKATALDRSSSCTEAVQRTVPIAFLRLNEQDNLQAEAEKLLQLMSASDFPTCRLIGHHG